MLRNSEIRSWKTEINLLLEDEPTKLGYSLDLHNMYLEIKKGIYVCVKNEMCRNLILGNLDLFHVLENICIANLSRTFETILHYYDIYRYFIYRFITQLFLSSK